MVYGFIECSNYGLPDRAASVCLPRLHYFMGVIFLFIDILIDKELISNLVSGI